jgi:periplasmic divalent cation tolerance protein
MRKTSSAEVVVLVTAPSEGEAAKIGRRVVEAGLAACANILPGIRSIFRWQGQVSEEREVLVILKTRRALFSDLAKAIKALHSYEVPEIIALPIGQGSTDYLQWIRAVTAKPPIRLKKSKKR